MKSLSGVDMMEVTRLTRTGRLAQAMQLLRGMHRKEPGIREGFSARAEYDIDPIESAADIVDMQPPSAANGGAWTAARTETPTVSVPRPASNAGYAPLRSALSGNFKPRFRTGVNAAKSLIDVPPGARSEERHFAGAGRQLSCRVYVPSSFDGTPMALVVMLHGCTQSPDDFAAGTRMNELAEEEGFLVAYPEQTSAANAMKCWSWFNPHDQGRDRGEPALIAGVTRALVDEFEIDAARVYIAGLSAGGAMAAIMGETYPDLYAAVGVHSGLAPGSAVDIASALALMKSGVSRQAPSRTARSTPTIIFHGDADTTVHPGNSDCVASRARGSARGSIQSTVGTSPGGIPFKRTIELDTDGRPLLEQWVVQGAGHAWSGGHQDGSFVEPRGPDASRAMWQFFSQISRPGTLKHVA